MSSPSSSSSLSCPKKMITLKSSDGETFEIEEIAALQSKTLENMIDENCADTPIPLPKIEGKVLAKVVEFCTKHAEVGVDAESLRAWDDEFVNVEHNTVFDYILDLAISAFFERWLLRICFFFLITVRLSKPLLCITYQNSEELKIPFYFW